MMDFPRPKTTKLLAYDLTQRGFRVLRTEEEDDQFDGEISLSDRLFVQVSTLHRCAAVGLALNEEEFKFWPLRPSDAVETLAADLFDAMEEERSLSDCIL